MLQSSSMTVADDPAADASTSASLSLWSDDPASVDLLAFDAVADTLVDAVLDDDLDPVALGVSGRWGSGKTTVLNLIQLRLRAEQGTVLPIPTDPWRYDPSLGAKESLITDVLAQLDAEIDDSVPAGRAAKELLGRLVKRVDWAKAMKLAAKTAVSPQLPSIGSLLELVRPGGDEEDEVPRTLDGFRQEFAELLSSDGLGHIRRVVVLVDDLDRCLPTTVVETLETIRLFLAVPKMSFVIAADEERVAEAISGHFSISSLDGTDSEHPSRLYLHKIVQTTIALPALSRFDTQAYLLLLQIAGQLEESELTTLIGQCAELRSRGATLDDLQPVGAVDLTRHLAFAARLTPILYEKLKGNPRRIKRFLNDLRVRQSVASRRGIELDSEVVAKLMVLEQLVATEFERVLDWMADGVLRTRMAELEAAAGRPSTVTDVSDSEAGDDGRQTVADAESSGDPEFSDDLLRWAKLPPALGGLDLTPYLHLAAGFGGKTLLDAQLPERLRDLAANLLSSSRAEQRSVADEDLAALRDDEPVALIQHLSRAARDRPREQRQALDGIIRILGQHPDATEPAVKALKAIPASVVEPAAVLLFGQPPSPALVPVLQHWRSASPTDVTRSALDRVLSQSG